MQRGPPSYRYFPQQEILIPPFNGQLSILSLLAKVRKPLGWCLMRIAPKEVDNDREEERERGPSVCRERDAITSSPFSRPPGLLEDFILIISCKSHIYIYTNRVLSLVLLSHMRDRSLKVFIIWSMVLTDRFL